MLFFRKILMVISQKITPLRIKIYKLQGRNIKLNIGSSIINYRGWISTDIDILDITKDSDWDKFFCADSVDSILAEHVWEHLSSEDSNLGLKNCYKYLKPGGRIRIAVPDGLFPDRDYIKMVKPGGYGNGSDDHKVLYTYKTLGKALEDAGFNIDLLEYFDENGKFNRKEWSSEDGHIRRSFKYDKRNENGLKYTSIIIDGIKK